MAVHNEVMFVTSINFYATHSTYMIELADIKHGKPVVRLKAINTCLGWTGIGILRIGDEVDVSYDDVKWHCLSIQKTAAQNAAATPNTASPKVNASGTVHNVKCFFLGYRQGSGSVLYIVDIALDDPKRYPRSKRYEAYLTKSSVFEAGLLNLKAGEELYLEYRDGGEIVFVTPTAGYQAKDLEERLLEEMEELLEDPDRPGQVPWKDLRNLCQQSVMFVCTGCDRDDRNKRCDFWEASIGVYRECSFFRASYGEVCDNIEAHKHCLEFGGGRSSSAPKKVEEKGWDETMREMGIKS